MEHVNPFQQPVRPVQLTIEADAATLDVLELRLEDEALSVTRYLEPAVAHVSVIAAQEQVPRLTALVAHIAPHATLRTLPLKDIDWVTQVQKDFPPFRLGRFYVHGSHVTPPHRPHLLPLRIDAVAAFGTGEHATTAGCLLALLAERRRRPHVYSVLDVGCGTAILAIGAAKLWPWAKVNACDLDSKAVEVARVNIRVNRTRARVHAYKSNGYKHRPIVALDQQGVVVANILARPLMRMARDAAKHLHPHGTLILSGLMNDQETMVLAAYRMQGFRLRARHRHGRWSVLVLGRA